MDMLMSRLGLSQRRACEIVGQHRSTQRQSPAEPDPDKRPAPVAARVLEAASPLGYRRAHAVATREGWAVNRKSIQRLWREEGWGSESSIGGCTVRS